jgi:rSAM/selenodomain-associated transferase 1
VHARLLLGLSRESDLPHQADLLTLGLMTKYWNIGRVKTRLGVTVGMERAASLHRLFVSYLSASLSDAADRNVICVAPDEDLPCFGLELESWGLAGVWEVMPQGGGDLGARMARWFQQFLGNRDARAVLIGADCPTLDAGAIGRAADLLRKNRVVLGPAADGGYYLIGLRGCWEADATRFGSLFDDIPWSTDQVLNVTRRRLGEAQLSYAELDIREDVDTIAELENLRVSLQDDRDRHALLEKEIDRILTDPTLSNPSPSDPSPR